MAELVIDTQVLAWWLIGSSKLVPEARQVMEQASAVYVPPCSLHEITLKVRKGRWPEMEPFAPDLDRFCITSGFRAAPYTLAMAMLSGSMEWDHADPFDRMIGATAVDMGLPLVSSDSAFDDLNGWSRWRGRVWQMPSPDDDLSPS